MFGCGSGGGTPGGTGGTGGSTTSSSSGTGGATTSSSSSSSSASSSSGTGGTGGATASSSSGTGGTGGATASSSSSTGGTGGAGTGGAGTGGTGGVIDPTTLDQDGDGWTPAQGDCCDVPNANCQKPEAVNPGAFEYPGNGVDDDCDPTTPDNAPTEQCSAASLFSNVTAVDLLKAMDLCRFADAVPATPKDNKWGVINGTPKLVLADGTTALPAANNVQVGVMTAFGTYVTPQKNATMASISSGTARASGDPGYVHPQNGKLANQTGGNYNGNPANNAALDVKIQSAYLTPHGGKPPAPAACSAACTTNCDKAYDSVNIKTQIRVPTNAKSFSYKFKFYSAEFPEYLCQKYNDFFVALLKSTWQPDPSANPPQSPLPEDTNIAFDAQKNPVSVNNSFFQVCFPPSGAPAGTCPSGTLELVGNGMGGWGTDLTDGGGTEWLTNTAPVVPGEIIELQFIVWDAGDHNVDSLVLLDHFRWSVTPSPVGISK
ncbi:Xanthine/uracil/thiamine/ascorbate permease family protein [Minicystis rosea]|nr:Xanthine/uracil/thiamine/ascorbate permease family protein [Minicystis rosea]